MDHALTTEVLEVARRRGAAAAGVAPAAADPDTRRRLQSLVASGRSGPLGFTYRRPDVATDPIRSFPWARSIVAVACGYAWDSAPPAATGPVVARFAVIDRYRPLRSVLAAVAETLQRRGYRAEPVADDNRMVDRAVAVRAGVGWWGKSTMVLTPGHGPWLLLGAVVTDAPLRSGEPMRRTCGTCTACLSACPTAALDGTGLDARRCLATWLQTPGSIPQWIRPLLGRRVYGCDDCLDACPPGHTALANASGAGTELGFSDLLALDDDELVERFRWWFVPRREGRYLRRNLLVAAGNSGEPEARDQVLAHLTHPSSMIRAHAYWAWGRGFRDGDRLHDALSVETVAEARDELTLALMMVEDPESHRAVLVADEWARQTRGVRALAVIERDPLRLAAFHDGAMLDAAPAGVDLVATSEDPGASSLISVYDPAGVIARLRRAHSERSGLILQRP